MSKVYYRVKDREITFDMVHDFIHAMGNEGHRYHNDQGFQQIADEMLNQELLLLDAKEKGFELETDFQKELEFAKEQLLKQYAIRKLLSDIEISDSEAMEMYEANKDQLSDMYRFNASHILVEDEEKAKELRENLDHGAPFEEVARLNSLDGSANNGGNLGQFVSGQMVPEFEKALLEMEVGSISDPVKTQFGYHIIKLNEKELEKANEFDAYKEDIKRALLGQKQEQKYLEKVEELKNKYEIESVE